MITQQTRGAGPGSVAILPSHLAPPKHSPCLRNLVDLHLARRLRV
jgi:hypothetical protein